MPNLIVWGINPQALQRFFGTKYGQKVEFLFDFPFVGNIVSVEVAPAQWSRGSSWSATVHIGLAVQFRYEKVLVSFHMEVVVYGFLLCLVSLIS